MLTSIIERRNDALDINRPNADRNLSVNGSNWLWAVTAVMGLTFLSWLAWTLLRNKEAQNHSQNVRKAEHNGRNNGNHISAAADESPRRQERVFHYLFTVAAFIGFISYFTMASNLGNMPIRQHLNHGANPLQTRQVYYVRYIYWFLAWPLVVIANLLLTGASWATILFAVALQEIWVVSWLCGALVSTPYKWGYFAIGVFAYFVLAYLLLSWGIQRARSLGTSKEYTLLAGILVLAWMVFPVAWGLCEGGNRLSITGEMIFYGILDFIAIPIYGTFFLFFARRFDPALYPFSQSGRNLHRRHVMGLDVAVPGTVRGTTHDTV